jgi:hypothetical protein
VNSVTLNCPVVLILVGLPLKPAPVFWALGLPALAAWLLTFPWPHLRDVQQATLFLYLWGWVRYFDVFPDTKEHITRFCGVVMPVGDPFVNPLDLRSQPSITPRVIVPTTNAANGASPQCRPVGLALNSAEPIPLYWLCYRHNNRISGHIRAWGIPH